MKNNTLNVGVVIVTYEQAPIDLVRSLNTKHNITYYLHHHGRKDLSNDLLDLFLCKESRIHLHYKNRGLARSWNDGILESFEEKNDITILVNDDIFFYENMFDEWLYFIIENNDSGLCFCYGDERSDEHGQITRSQDFACFSFNKMAFNNVGCFDEMFSPAYYEDADFNIRAKKLNIKIAIDKITRVFHDRSQTIRNNHDLRSELKIFFENNKNLYYKKWGDNEEYIYPYNDTTKSCFMSFLGNRKSL